VQQNAVNQEQRLAPALHWAQIRSPLFAPGSETSETSETVLDPVEEFPFRLVSLFRSLSETSEALFRSAPGLFRSASGPSETFSCKKPPFSKACFACFACFASSASEGGR
jgi:hypothetical protein